MKAPYPARGERAKKSKQAASLRGPVQPAAKYRAPMKGMKNVSC